jgi:hypothetical protein
LNKIEYRKADDRKEAYCLVKRYLKFDCLEQQNLAYHLDCLDRKRMLCLRCQDLVIDFSFSTDALSLEVVQHGPDGELEKKLLQEITLNVRALI